MPESSQEAHRSEIEICHSPQSVWVQLILGLAVHEHHHDGVVHLLALAVGVGAEGGHDVLVDLVVRLDPL